MKSFIVIATLALLAGCNTIDSTYNSAHDIVQGVKKDVVGITAGTLESVSGVIRDTADKTDPKSK
jgi:hypothetical protein